MSPPSLPQSSRRDFLTYATAGVGVITLAAAARGLQASMVAPKEPSLSLAIDLGGIAEGTEIMVPFKGIPYMIRHRTAAEIAAAEAVDPAALPDPLAQNANLPSDALAVDANRRASPDGRFIVMEMRCTHMSCVVLGASGDFGGSFCPCHGSHFDTAGRVRSAPATRNLPIPNFSLTEDGILVLLPSQVISEAGLDLLIYGPAKD